MPPGAFSTDEEPEIYECESQRKKQRTGYDSDVRSSFQG